MGRYTCPVCAEEFETLGHPDPEQLTCFNCNQKAANPGYGYDRTEGIEPPVEPQVWYTVDEAARYLRLPREVVFRLVNQGHLTAYKVTGRGNERFARQDLEAMMERVDVSVRTPIDPSKVLIASPSMQDLWDNELDAIYDFY